MKHSLFLGLASLLLLSGCMTIHFKGAQTQAVLRCVPPILGCNPAALTRHQASPRLVEE
jgi:hypothetical protein